MRTSILSRLSRSTFALTASFFAAATLTAACSDDNELHSWQPPSGTGGFNPGNGGISSGSGSGSGAGSSISSGTSGSGGGGGGGGGPVGPPMCDDSLKRCAHLFTYPVGTETSVEVRGDFAPGAWMSGVPMTKQGSTWQASVELPYNKDVLYKFFVNGTTWVIDPNNMDQVSDGFGGYNSRIAATTCDPWTCEPPQLGDFDWRDAVLYFVFVDRFLDGDPTNNGTPTDGVQTAADYRGGDWAGVLQKVQDGYFNSLGVNALWLTVPMDNTEQSGLGTGGDSHLYSAYHGYWPKRLDAPEEHFGALTALAQLVDAAHAKGIKVILDYAMNHVHKSSPVYQQHMSDGWFWPLSDGTVSNCVCGSASCGWDGPYAKRCWFTDYLPDFNFTNPDARSFSVSNALWWIQQTNIDGFRLDAVKHIEDQWLIDLRARVKAEVEPKTKQHFYMVGETFSGDRNAIAYYVNPATMLDGQFDFPLRAALAQAVLTRQSPMSDFRSFLDGYDNAYGAGIMSTFIGNHDVPRAIHFAQDQPLWDSVWSDGKNLSWNNQPSLPATQSAFERVANAFTFLFTTKGIPLIYYGDEVGMAGAGDPDNRRMMQWSGYSAGQSFLLDRVKKLGAIRAAHPALRRGTRQSISATADTFAYKMTLGSEVVYVVINRGDSAQQVGGLPSGSLKELITDRTASGPTVTVGPRSSAILLAP